MINPIYSNTLHEENIREGVMAFRYFFKYDKSFFEEAIFLLNDHEAQSFFIPKNRKFR